MEVEEKGEARARLPKKTFDASVFLSLSLVRSSLGLSSLALRCKREGEARERTSSRADAESGSPSGTSSEDILKQQAASFAFFDKRKKIRGELKALDFWVSLFLLSASSSPSITMLLACSTARPAALASSPSLALSSSRCTPALSSRAPLVSGGAAAPRRRELSSSHLLPPMTTKRRRPRSKTLPPRLELRPPRAWTRRSVLSSLCSERGLSLERVRGIESDSNPSSIFDDDDDHDGGGERKLNLFYPLSSRSPAPAPSLPKTKRTRSPASPAPRPPPSPPAPPEPRERTRPSKGRPSTTSSACRPGSPSSPEVCSASTSSSRRRALDRAPDRHVVHLDVYRPGPEGQGVLARREGRAQPALPADPACQRRHPGVRQVVPPGVLRGRRSALRGSGVEGRRAVADAGRGVKERKRERERERERDGGEKEVFNFLML